MSHAARPDCILYRSVPAGPSVLFSGSGYLFDLHSFLFFYESTNSCHMGKAVGSLMMKKASRQITSPDDASLAHSARICSRGYGAAMRLESNPPSACLSEARGLTPAPGSHSCTPTIAGTPVAAHGDAPKPGVVISLAPAFVDDLCLDRDYVLREHLSCDQPANPVESQGLVTSRSS